MTDEELAYRDRLIAAVYEAIVDASSDDGKTAVILTGTAAYALTKVIALLVAGSSEVDTPAKIEAFSRHFAADLALQLAVEQADPRRKDLINEEYDLTRRQ